MSIATLPDFDMIKSLIGVTLSLVVTWGLVSNRATTTQHFICVQSAAQNGGVDNHHLLSILIMIHDILFKIIQQFKLKKN